MEEILAIIEGHFYAESAVRRRNFNNEMDQKVEIQPFSMHPANERRETGRLRQTRGRERF